MGEEHWTGGVPIASGEQVDAYVAMAARNRLQTVHTDNEAMVVEFDGTITHFEQTEVHGIVAPATMQAGLELTGVFRRSGLFHRRKLLEVAEEVTAVIRPGDELQLQRSRDAEPIRTGVLSHLLLGGVSFASLEIQPVGVLSQIRAS